MSESTTAERSIGEDNTILDLRDVTVRFDMDRGTATVLDSVEIAIPRESIIGVVGESGSGKSMFASALLDAVVDPGTLTGEITYHPEEGDPVDVLDLSKEELKEFRWEEISMVFQGAQRSFNPTMSVREHFKETLRAHDHDVEEGLERTEQLLLDVYLEPDRVLDSYPHELSGGMQQRALIALSLLLEPEVLVMDEPTAALDLLMQRSITKMLSNLQQKYDLTILFITHDLPLVTGLADRISVMYAFHFVESGPTKEVLLNAAHPYTRALLKTVPNVNLPLEEMRPIEGDSPDPVNVPDGCSYHPRCPLATDKCRYEAPPFHEVSSDHSVACYHWEQSEDEIPYSLTQGGDRS
jgi:oligopeptide/dipeptide ABC transporter ATP-binding protein